MLILFLEAPGTAERPAGWWRLDAGGRRIAGGADMAGMAPLPGEIVLAVPPATAVTLVDYNTATFTLPTGLADGVHALAIAAGALSDLQRTPLSAWTAQFTVDTTAPTPNCHSKRNQI